MFKSDRASWYNNFDDSTRFSPAVEAHWTNQYMQSTFHGWGSSNAAPDSIWTGIMGATPDGKPHIGRVPGSKRQWMLAGFNGGGMTFIPVAAQAVAKMVCEDLGFEQVKEEFGLLEGFGTAAERLSREREEEGYGGL
jgi:glycine/D-amino acid oxidase-like deaminating enzyme